MPLSWVNTTVRLSLAEATPSACPPLDPEGAALAEDAGLLADEDADAEADADALLPDAGGLLESLPPPPHDAINATHISIAVSKATTLPTFFIFCKSFQYCFILHITHYSHRKSNRL